jgi:eukaryotic-like serine/threonine-protein kinase
MCFPVLTSPSGAGACDVKKIGQYEVIAELGRGAMGVVYKARHPKINMLVALKTITTSVADNPELLQRFYREGQALGALQHPNIATIYDMGEDEGLPFIAMEYVDGQTLGEIIAHRAPIALYLKLDYAIQACRALDYAHKRGIIHRDIKPGNVMVSKLGAVKVVDFGIARVLETSHTKSGIIMGTFAYMPPEVYHGEHADARSDIFSFGILLYELICYSKPFPGENPASFMQSICLQDPKPLRQTAPDCPAELDSVVEKMLLKPVADRYQTMEDLLLDLEPICRMLQAETVAELIAQSRALIEQEEFSQARDILRQVQQLDFGNTTARAMLVKVDAALKKKLARPKVEQFVEIGIASLESGKLDEALALANSALELDSTFVPAQELQRNAGQEISRARFINEKLQAAKQRLAEGLLDEVESLLAPVLEQDPANRQALSLQEAALEERSRRQKLRRLLENMQQARVLWTNQKYDECIDLLTGLEKEFPEEEDIRKLMETAREDRAEQRRQRILEEVRNLLAARRYSACEEALAGLQKEFPNDDGIPKLLETVREDQARQRKIERLADARNLLASKRHEESIALLAELGKEFPNDDEIEKFVKIVHEDQDKQRRQQGVAEARNLLAARRYEDCNALLAGLQKQFPDDDTILELVADAREEQARQRKIERLAHARNLLGSKHHDESLALLAELGKEFANDYEVEKLVKIIREDQAKQRRLQGLVEARTLLAARRYEDCNTLLAKLGDEFPNDDEIPKLLEAVREDQREQRKLGSMAEARNLRASKRYDDALSLLSSLDKDFAGEEDILKLRQLVQDEWAEQRLLKGLADARSLLSSKNHEASITLLADLQKEFPAAKEIPKLRELVQDEWAEQRLQRGLAEARKLLSSKNYEASITLLADLQKQFPAAKEISKLRELVQGEWAEERLQKGLADARELLSARRYEESIALLADLQKTFPLAKEISKVQATARQERAEQERQQKITTAKTLLAAQRWDEALALLDSLLAAQPKDAAVLKLKTLVQSEQEKHAKSERLQREWEVLKELTGKEAYAEAISRAQELLKDFPGDGNLLRLLEFAREQHAQRERALQLRNTLDEVEALLKGNHLSEAIVAANLGLKSFPQSADLSRLLEQAETRQKREQTRQAIEQRVRSIKIKINREELSDAIRMAEDALSTLGPDTDVTQLLTSARVEYNAREKKRETDSKLETVRTLCDSGKLEEATLVLDETIKSKDLDPSDPRVRRLAEDINAAKTVAEKVDPVAPSSAPQSPAAREYALWTPALPTTSPAEGSTQQAKAAKASASPEPIVSQPVAPPPPAQVAPIAASPAAPPPTPVMPSVDLGARPPSVKPPIRPAADTVRSLPSDSSAAKPPVNLPDESEPWASSSAGVPPATIGIWKNPKVLGVGLLGLILIASSVFYLRSRSSSTGISQPSPVASTAPSTTAPSQSEPQVTPPAVPPASTDNKELSALLQQEDQLWNRAKAETDNARFAQAQQDLGKILALPAGGRRKDDARSFLDQVIPKRQHEEQLFAEALQSSRQNNSGSLQHASDLFGEVAKLGGPRQREAQKLQSDALASLGNLNGALANLMASARSDLSRGEFGSARKKSEQIQQTGGDTTLLNAEINQSEQRLLAQLESALSQLKQRRDEGALQSLKNLQAQFQSLSESGGPIANDARRDADSVAGIMKEVTASVTAAATAETAYQAALGRYQRAADLNALEASRGEFQSIARGGGPHAGDAQRIVGEINPKIAALAQPTPPINPPADEKPSIRAAVLQYSAAFEKRDAEALRKIWPYMSNADYERYKNSFSMADAIRMNWSNINIVDAPDHTTATVTIDVAQEYTPKGSKKAMKQADHEVFHLVKQNGTWLIKDRQ